MSSEPEEQELPVNGCPTPLKRRFATEESAQTAANRAAVVYGKTLYPYDTCVCTWWHLTSKKRRAADSTERTFEDIRALSDEAFGALVRADVKGRAPENEAAFLREAPLLLRWSEALKKFQISLELQLAAKQGERDFTTRKWRQSTAIVRRSLADRRAEVKQLLREASPGAVNPQVPDPEKAAHAKVLRADAGDRALDRLVKAHPVEFTQYLVEEYGKAGVEVPSRILRHRERHLREQEMSEGEARDTGEGAVPGTG